MKTLNISMILSGLFLMAFSLNVMAQEVKSNKSKPLAVDFANIENTPAEIVITKPVFLKESSIDPIVIDSDEVEIAGMVRDKNGVKELLMNGGPIAVDGDGYFSFNYPLSYGINSMTLEVVDNYGEKTTREYLMNRDQGALTFSLKVTGKYYALIIGINDYQDPRMNDLDEAVKDAEKLNAALSSKYTFDQENIILLKNPTYVQMIASLDDLSKRVRKDDNLLIFYAGHGYWDEERELGYWLPNDAQKENTAFWIPNSRISDYIGSIKAKHTLLIADACFSGSIFKTRAAFVDAQPAINKLYQLPSRKAMTSGALKEVPDKSVFLQYLVKRLDENPEKYISSENLFSSFRMAVMNNSPNMPQYGTVQNAGDEGGDFIFIRR